MFTRKHQRRFFGFIRQIVVGEGSQNFHEFKVITGHCQIEWSVSSGGLHVTVITELNILHIL